MEPLPRLEAAEPDGARRSNPSGVGYLDLGREPWHAGLRGYAPAGPGGHYGFHLAGKPRL